MGRTRFPGAALFSWVDFFPSFDVALARAAEGFVSAGGQESSGSAPTLRRSIVLRGNGGSTSGRMLGGGRGIARGRAAFFAAPTFFVVNAMGSFPFSFCESNAQGTIHGSRRSGPDGPGGERLPGESAARWPPRPQLDEEKSGRRQRDHSPAQSQKVALGRLLHHEETTRRCTSNSAFKITFAINKGPNFLLQTDYVIVPVMLLSPRGRRSARAGQRARSDERRVNDLGCSQGNGSKNSRHRTRDPSGHRCERLFAVSEPTTAWNWLSLWNHSRICRACTT